MARAKWTNEREVRQRIKAAVGKSEEDVREAVAGAASAASEEILRRGRADIAAGGRFGSAWTSAFQAPVTTSGNITTIDVKMAPQGPPVIYWKIFEYGATITAKGTAMAIPFDTNNKTWPRDYPGKLFRKGRALFDTKTKEAVYFLTPQVHIPQKWHLREIAKEVAKELKQFLSRSLRR